MPHVAFVCLGLVWGTNFIFMKMAVSVLDPLQVVWLRVLFGSAPIVVFALLRRSLKLYDARHAHHFLAMSLLANVLPYYFFVKGTEHLASGVAGVISGTIPLMTLLFAVLFLPTARVSRRKLLGFVAGFAGVALVARRSGPWGTDLEGDLTGVAYMLCGSVSYASAMIYAHRFVAPLRLSALQLATYQTACASLLLTSTTSFDGIGAIWTDCPLLLTLGLGLGLIGTGFAFVMYYVIIERLGAVMASSVYYLPPLVALLIGAAFMDEGLTTTQASGTSLLLGGLYLARKEAEPVAGSARTKAEARADPLRLHQSQDVRSAGGPRL